MVKWKHKSLALVGLSLALVIAGLAFLLLQTEDAPRRNTLESYYMEVELQVEPS